jgi:hypothetical protein
MIVEGGRINIAFVVHAFSPFTKKCVQQAKATVNDANQIDRTRGQMMQNNMAYLIDTYRAATHDLRSPNAKTPSSGDYHLCMTAQPRSSHPHREGAFTHSQDWKGLYSPLVSKLLIPGYVIQGVPSPRQWLSLRCCQHLISSFFPYDRRKAY